LQIPEESLPRPRARFAKEVSSIFFSGLVTASRVGLVLVGIFASPFYPVMHRL